VILPLSVAFTLESKRSCPMQLLFRRITPFHKVRMILMMVLLILLFEFIVFKDE